MSPAEAIITRERIILTSSALRRERLEPQINLPTATATNVIARRQMTFDALVCIQNPHLVPYENSFVNDFC